MSTLLYIFLNFCLVLAQDNRPDDANNHFVYPPLPGPQFSNDPSVFNSNLNFTVGRNQAQPFKWVTNMTDMQIILCQEGNPDSVQSHEITECIDGTSNDSIYWDGDIGPIDLNNGSQAYLGVWNCSDFTTPVFFSHYMNLIEAPADSTTSSATTTSTSSSSVSSLATAATTSSTTSSTPAADPSPSPAGTSSSSGSSNGAAIGGGIGGGIGGALVLIAAAFAFWKYRSGKEKGQPGATQQIADWSNHPEYNAMSPSQGSGVFKPSFQPSELGSQPPSVSELPPSSVGPAVNPDPRRVYEM
ncbi:hypothetical protein F4781DRAFT_392874 [Annulohypoxylon bovei var. microspora]|nr:hypothetical protein F4781DRAFT_392874 [Annulohypoxylon bovei var. microspora]